MLTNLHYYDFYKPYIINNSNSNTDRVYSRRRTNNHVYKDSSVYLNKSLKKDVVNYAKEIYKSVTDLKLNSKKILDDINYYKKAMEFEQPIENFESFAEGFEIDIKNYISAYNNSTSFLMTQSHSQGLNSFANKLLHETHNYSGALNKAVIIRDERGLIPKEGENISDPLWHSKNSYKILDKVEDYFASVYDDTSKALKAPMSNHMNFKNLNYYYNYKIAAIQVDTFKIINNGLLVNIAL